MKFLAIVGSDSDNSVQRRLVEFIEKHFADKYDFEVAEVSELPLFKEGVEEPESVKKLAQQVLDSDAVIISTEEIQHSISSSLKSAIEWLSSAEHPFTNKPLMVIGASKRPQGSAYAQVRLKNVLASPGVGAIVYNNDEFMMGNAEDQFDENGNLPEGTVKFLDHFFDEFNGFYQGVHNYFESKKAN